MQTTLRIGPHDHGRELTDDEFFAADYEEGYKYELIDGSLYVSPKPNFPHDVRAAHRRDARSSINTAPGDMVRRFRTKPASSSLAAERRPVPEPDFAIYNDCPQVAARPWQDKSVRSSSWRSSATIRTRSTTETGSSTARCQASLEYWVFDKWKRTTARC